MILSQIYICLAKLCKVHFMEIFNVFKDNFIRFDLIFSDDNNKCLLLFKSLNKSLVKKTI